MTDSPCVTLRCAGPEMGATVEPHVADRRGQRAAQVGDHPADVVAVDVRDHGDVDARIVGQPGLEQRPGVGRAAVDEHPPRWSLLADALDQEAVAEPCGERLETDRRLGYPWCDGRTSGRSCIGARPRCTV